jgi:peptide chain release factor
MIEPKREVLLQITAGQGPAECAWAVVRTLQELLKEAAQAGFAVMTVDVEQGPEDGTAYSVLVCVSGGNGLDLFTKSWRGTVQWIAQSPFRPEHKRKNWFVGVEVFEMADEIKFDANDITWETMRASGPGGQHVNRTESAVRVTHVKSGMQAVASKERSQHSNRKLALTRLARKIADSKQQKKAEDRARRWRAQHELERGNPVRVFRNTNSPDIR